MNLPQAQEYIVARLKNELSPTLYYHNVIHTLDVADSVERLAIEEHVTGEDVQILRTAALYHDTGFLQRYEVNEPIGAHIAREALPGFGYTDRQAEIVCDLIIATRMPQNPQTLLQQILCDADLDYLGRPDFYIISHRLQRELAEHGSPTTLREWYGIELEFLQTHHYFTGAARLGREPLKQRFIKDIRELLNGQDISDGR